MLYYENARTLTGTNCLCLLEIRVMGVSRADDRNMLALHKMKIYFFLNLSACSGVAMTQTRNCRFQHTRNTRLPVLSSV